MDLLINAPLSNGGLWIRNKESSNKGEAQVLLWKSMDVSSEKIRLNPSKTVIFFKRADKKGSEYAN